MPQLFIQEEEDSDDELLLLELRKQEDRSKQESVNNISEQVSTQEAVTGSDNAGDIEVTIPVRNEGPLINGPNEEGTKEGYGLESDDEDEDADATLYPLIPNDYNTDNNQNLKPNIDDIRPVDVQLGLCLPFQQQIIENCLVLDDPLLILGKGLGMSTIVANLLHILATPTKINGQLKRSLVIVLNAKPEDNMQIKEELDELCWLEQRPDEDGPEAAERLFHVVTSDELVVEKRQQLYLTGGIVSITSRILIVDLLSGVLAPNKVTGLIMLNVDSLKNNSNEFFIVEIYRSRNSWGFIKGFSETPELFVKGFSPLLKRMRELKFKNVLLWPRFRVEVSSCLNSMGSSARVDGRAALPKNFTNTVIEVKIAMTDNMSQVQFGLMECLKKCIEELNRKNPELSQEWWTSENALDDNFLKSIDAVMIPNWHRISYESKQLIKDIRFLKHLLKLLVTGDAIDMYSEIQASLDANKPSISRVYTESPWLMAEESQIVISYTRKRIYDNGEYVLEELPKWEQLLDILEDIADERLRKNPLGPTLIVGADSRVVTQITRVLQAANRKKGIRQMLLNRLHIYKHRREELKRIINETREKDSLAARNELNVSTTFSREKVNTKRRRTRGAAVVAAVQRLKTAGAGNDIEGAIDEYDIKKELEKMDGGSLGDDLVQQGVGVGIDDSPKQLEDWMEKLDPSAIEVIEGYENTKDSYIDSNNDEIHIELGDEGKMKRVETDTYINLTKKIWDERALDFDYIYPNDEVLVESFANIKDNSLLQEIKPAYIIMLQPDLAFMRRVELYCGFNSDNRPKIYFLYYAESVEEQHYLGTIKKERDAFTKLIREHAQLAQHYETLEDLSHFKNLAKRKIKLNKLNKRNTRIAGGQLSTPQNLTKDMVIVDTREFNASLPGLLFRYGVCVVPCMLSVGDYIITPDICLERKSVSDLIQSLRNNRLVNQCKKMFKYYKYPTLLIEFSEEQSFSLEPFSEVKTYRRKVLSTTHPISNKLAQDDIQQKLARLVMRFPGLKIIWSSSPLQSVNIILELKLGREQPDPTEVVGYGASLRKGAKPPVNPPQDDSYAKLLNVPGISKIDYFNIKRKVKSYNKLKAMSLQQLVDLTGDSDIASLVYKFLEEERQAEEEEDEEGEDGS